MLVLLQVELTPSLQPFLMQFLDFEEDAKDV
jgi:hypothetical protein